MKTKKLNIKDVIVFQPEKIEDERGHFFESFKEKYFSEVTGRKITVLQENTSFSYKGVIRGLHYQLPPFEQGKLIKVENGEIFDVAVDLRKNSPSFSKWVSYNLNDESNEQIWIPPGFAHGFQVISETAQISYKCDNYYSKQNERSIKWDDYELGINWPISENIRTSIKDREAKRFQDAEKFLS